MNSTKANIDAPKRQYTNRMHQNRRRMLGSIGLAVTAMQARSNVTPMLAAEKSAVKLSLFDGKSLAGWRAVPRLTIPKVPAIQNLPPDQLREAVIRWHEARPDMIGRLSHIGDWKVENDVIVGGHAPPDSQLGCYLLSEQKFSDFELELEARPDWPIDTGIMLRTHELGGIGFQVLLDHRPSGGMGGVFGNNIGSFLAAPFTIDGDKLPNFQVTNLREGGREPQFSSPAMDYSAKFADFAQVWKLNTWNHFRIRCVGLLPTITTWINGLKICELDTSKIATPGFDADAVIARLGRAGHIGFEVHDINLNNPLGQDRWATGAVCRWRNIFITELV